MKTTARESQPQKAVEAGTYALKVNKACVPCRTRKIKCDAPVVGLPCSSCRSRSSAEDCIPLGRKSRLRKGTHVLPTPSQTTSSSARPSRRQSKNQLKSNSTSDATDVRSPGQVEPNLLCLHISKDAVERSRASSQLPSTAAAYRPQPAKGLTLRNCLSTEPAQLDRIDREYLANKGVFDLPQSHHLDALVKLYFDHVHPLFPVMNRAHFIHLYQSGDCSLLLLRVMLTPASLHAPTELLSACGYTDRSAAQDSLFSKARLLHDIAAEEDCLLMLQASMILCMVILDHATDKDFDYWFHNSINLATKLNLRDIVCDITKPNENLKLYRRIWWTLYCLDIFHVFINTRRTRLLESSYNIELETEDDWEDEYNSGNFSGLVSVAKPQQSVLHVALCELSQVFGEYLASIKRQPQQNPHQIMQAIGTWRQSFASKLHIDGNMENDVLYLNIQAMSYRYECILLRLMRRNLRRLERTEWSEWADKRFRSAILELHTIALRVSATTSIEKLPVPLITTITALLALHIESALDPTETHLTRSMSRISISQTMLILNQGREIPVLKRLLPIFEEILTKKNLYSPDNFGQSNGREFAGSPLQDSNMASTYASPQTHISGVSPHSEQWDNYPLLDMGFLGFDSLDEWQQIGQLDFPG